MRVVLLYLSEREGLGGGATSGTNRLFHEGHGEALVRDAVSSSAGIFRFRARQMEMNSQKDVFLFIKIFIIINSYNLEF